MIVCTLLAKLIAGPAGYLFSFLLPKLQAGELLRALLGPGAFLAQCEESEDCGKAHEQHSAGYKIGDSSTHDLVLGHKWIGYECGNDVGDDVADEHAALATYDDHCVVEDDRGR